MVVNLEEKKYLRNLTKDVKYGFWNFGGTVLREMEKLRAKHEE